jgi:enamine deaminase RidA (YjgF/YER057c/UK114 family)
MTIELINPDALTPTSGAYSHLAIGRGSRLIFVAGQVGLDRDGDLAGDEHASQAQQAFRNVAAALEAAGASVRDVAKLTTFVVGHHAELIQPIMAARASVFGDHSPANTYVGVEKLIRPELLIEVEAVAVVD